MKKKFFTCVCVLFIGCLYSYSLESYLGLGAGISLDGKCDSITLDVTFRDFYDIPLTYRLDMLFENENIVGFGAGAEIGIKMYFLDVLAGIEEAIIWNREYSDIESVFKINAAVQFYINELVYIKPNLIYIIRFDHDEFTMSEKNKFLLGLGAGIRI